VEALISRATVPVDPAAQPGETERRSSGRQPRHFRV